MSAIQIKNDVPRYDLSKHVIYDHAGVVAINKPQGIGMSVINECLNDITHSHSKRKVNYSHRLDHFTSGILLCSRDVLTARALSAMFIDRKIKKTYLAVLDGTPSKVSGTIETPQITKIFPAHGFPVDGMKPAKTDFSVLQKRNGMSLVEFSPHTGRRHQLRIHSAEVLKCPMMGDQDHHPYFRAVSKSGSLPCKFNNKSVNRHDLYRMEGQILHAWKIAFTHPSTGEYVRLTAPMPDDRAQLVEDLGFNTVHEYDQLVI